MTREETAALLRSCRLMLLAWRGARITAGHPDNHTELNGLIAEIEQALEKLK